MSSAANLYPAPEAVPTTNSVVTAQHTSGGSAAGGTAATVSPMVAGVTGSAPSPTPKLGKLAAFEGLLKRAGHIAGIVLTDIVKYAIPLSSIVAVADPAAAPAVEAFAASLKLVQSTVISVQQKWAADGAGANVKKLADVLEIVEQPIVTMFGQAGLLVDRAYVTNLVTGVVAILNAQPGVVLPNAA